MKVGRITKAAARRREESALDELQTNHSYLFFELLNKRERSTVIARTYRRNPTGPAVGMKLRDAVAIKLVVPEDSALGKRILAMRKQKPIRPRKPAAKRAIDRALGRKPSEPREAKSKENG